MSFPCPPNVFLVLSCQIQKDVCVSLFQPPSFCTIVSETNPCPIINNAQSYLLLAILNGFAFSHSTNVILKKAPQSFPLFPLLNLNKSVSSFSLSDFREGPSGTKKRERKRRSEQSLWKENDWGLTICWRRCDSYRDEQELNQFTVTCSQNGMGIRIYALSLRLWLYEQENRKFMGKSMTYFLTSWLTFWAEKKARC